MNEEPESKSEERTDEPQEELPEKVSRAYRRAGLGLAAVAMLWIVAFLFTKEQSDAKNNWLIPIGAAALSVLCFSRYRKLKESEE